MSGHNQRPKIKSVPRLRNQRLPVPSQAYVKQPQQPSNFGSCDDDLGIFANYELTYVIGRHVIGNVAEITTTDENKVLGLIKAVSPSGDMGLTFACGTQKSGKADRLFPSERLVPFKDIKMVHIANVRLTDYLTDELKTDSEIAGLHDHVDNQSFGKKLVPFFNPLDALSDCMLDAGGFPADEMFKTNEKLFSVSSTFNPDLREYTTPVDRSAPNYIETEARCAKLAREIENNQQAKDLDDICDQVMEDEEKYSAVSRPGAKESSSYYVRSARSSRISHDRANILGSRIQVNSTQNLSDISDSLKVSSTAECQVLVVAPKLEKEDLNHIPDKPCIVDSNDKLDVSTPIDKAEPLNIDFDLVDTTVEERVKKSTLDPNAPEFHPMSLQFSSAQFSAPSDSSAGQLTGFAPNIAHNYMHALNASQNMPYSVPSVPGFVTTTQVYAASTVPYGSQSNPVPQLIPTTVHHMRAGSLPSHIQQNFATGFNHTGGFLSSGLPFQLMNAPQVIVPGAGGAGHRYAPASTIGLSRQRSNESATQQASSCAQSQQSTSIPNIQHALFPLPQPNSLSFIVPGHGPMNIFPPTGVPGVANSSALVVGGMGMPQVGQQAYAPHTMFQMQASNPPSDQSSSSQQQPGYPPQFHHIADQHVHIQPPHNMIFAPQPPTYYTAAPMLAGPNSVGNTFQPGILPIISPPSSQQTLLGTGTHHQAISDQAMTNNQSSQSAQQFAQSGYQHAQWLSQFAASHPHFLHAQNIPALVQPNQYQQALAALAATGGASSQPH